MHLVRHSLNFCGWKDRKAVAKDLKLIYQAVDDGEAAKALDDFEAEWGDKYPSIAPSWRRAWQEVIPFFAFPGSAPGRGVIPTLARTEWSLARSSGEVRAGCWAAMDVLR